jgi:hypothetical protein
LFITNIALLRTSINPIHCRFGPSLLSMTMEIKFELDTDKAARATIAIAASYALGRVSEGTNPQLAFANSVALIIIIAILYSNCPAPLIKSNTSLLCE